MIITTAVRVIYFSKRATHSRDQFDSAGRITTEINRVIREFRDETNHLEIREYI